MNSTQQTPLHDPKEKFYRDTFNKLGVPVPEPKPETWVHSLKCTRDTQDGLDKLNAWNEQWPNACIKCDGWGIYTCRNTMDYGSTTATLESNKPCEGCTEKGACPRCGEMILATAEQFEQFFDHEEVCPLCGWSWGRSPGDIKPEVPAECYCRSAEDWV